MIKRYYRASTSLSLAVLGMIFVNMGLTTDALLIGDMDLEAAVRISTAAHIGMYVTILQMAIGIVFWTFAGVKLLASRTSPEKKLSRKRLRILGAALIASQVFYLAAEVDYGWLELVIAVNQVAIGLAMIVYINKKSKPAPVSAA